MGNLVKKFLSQDDLKAIADAIGEAEQRTSGEIRVSVRQKRERRERGLSVEEIARQEFVKLGMVKTVERTGILIFVLVESREFFVLADQHINDTVATETWSDVARQITESFARGEHRNGLVSAVKSVGAHLAEHFPRRPGDVNELPNNVVVS